MTKRYYEDFEIGDTAEPPMGRTISESDVYTQAGLAGSYNPLHTDRELMRESDYDGRLVQNTLLITIMSGLQRRLPWDPETIAAYGRENIRFIEPVFIGDTVRMDCEVVEKRERDAESGIITLRQQLFNQSQDLVATGDNMILVRRSP